ncbi:hypothetical protein U9M48_039115 [Paspalum notatum var. saurae]|uniref:YDG domain-containing protein n=1 Tax=Paspalum notatum var. saurae TaxID=547442 RepID=A0AAQ3UJF1_PASNO
MDSLPEGLQAHAARLERATGAAAASTVRGSPSPQKLGDGRRRSSPPPPRAPEGRRGDSGAGKAVEEVGVAGNAVAAGVVDGDGGKPGVAREEMGAGGERRFGSFPAPRAYPPPKRRAVSARRRFPPGCGRDAAPLPAAGDGDGGSDDALQLQNKTAPSLSVREADTNVMEGSVAAVVSAPLAGADDGSRLVLAGVHGGGSDALQKAAPSPSKAGSNAMEVSPVTVSAPHADTGGGHGLEAAPPRSPEPLPRSSLAAAGAALDTDWQGDAEAGSSGFGRKKELVPAKRLLPKPGMASAVRRFPPGCGRVRVVATDGSTSATGQRSKETAAAPYSGAITDGAVQGGHTEERSETPEMRPVVQQSQTSIDVIQHESVACDAATDAKVMNKSDWRPCSGVPESLAKGTSRQQQKAKRVSESPKRVRASFDIAPRVSDQGAMIRNKSMFTTRNIVVKPGKSIQKSAMDSRPRPFANDREKKTELGRCVTTIDSEDTAEFTKDRVVQAPTSVDKCARTDSEMATTSRDFFGPKKVKIKAADLQKLPSNLACEILKALADHEKQFSQNMDARSKVKMVRRRFEFIFKAIVQAAEQHSLKIKRIDLEAGNVIKKSPGYTQHGPIIGSVPGVEIGDEYLYRVELSLVGLHRPYQGGIDTTKDRNDVLIAISIVASGGYPDELSSSGELVYTGSGGKLSGKKGEGDQKLERGNLALKNCIQMNTPVRVIHGFGGNSRTKETSTFTYDGLYHVVDCWTEGQSGSKAFKYKLQRIAGQPELRPSSKAALRRKTGIISSVQDGLRASVNEFAQTVHEPLQHKG